MVVSHLPTGGPGGFFKGKIVKAYNKVFLSVPQNRRVMFCQGGWPNKESDAEEIYLIACATHLACILAATPSSSQVCVTKLMRAFHPDKHLDDGTEYRKSFCADTLWRFFTKYYKVVRGTFYRANDLDITFPGLLYTGFEPSRDAIPSSLEIAASIF